MVLSRPVRWSASCFGAPLERFPGVFTDRHGHFPGNKRWIVSLAGRSNRDPHRDPFSYWPSRACLRRGRCRICRQQRWFTTRLDRDSQSEGVSCYRSRAPDSRPAHAESPSGGRCRHQQQRDAHRHGHRISKRRRHLGCGSWRADPQNPVRPR